MSAVRRRAVAVLTVAVLFPGTIGGGSAAAQSTSPADRSATPTTTSTTTPTATATIPTATTTTPEVTAADTPKGVLLESADRVELASSLADATEQTGVCFGYEVELSGSGASSREESLSSFGPDRSIASAAGLTTSSTFYSSSGTSTARTVTGQELRTRCPKGALVLDVSLTYTSSSSESEDSASFRVDATPGLQGAGSATGRLRDLTGVDEKDLLGDEDDLALRNLAAALPLTLDDAVPAADTATTASARAPNGDRLTGSPGSDWLRAHGLGIAIAFGLLLLGVVLVLGGRTGRKQADQPKRPSGPGSSSTTTTP